MAVALAICQTHLGLLQRFKRREQTLSIAKFAGHFSQRFGCFTEGFTRLWPSVTVAVCYETAFILLALSMKKIPIGIVYAVWSGVGIMLITLAAWFFLGQTLDLAGFAGVALIISGVVVINVFSSSVVD